MAEVKHMKSLQEFIDQLAQLDEGALHHASTKFELLELATILQSELESIRKKVKAEKPVDRWRAEKGGLYWYIDIDSMYGICRTTDVRSSNDGAHFDSRNYYRNERTAFEVWGRVKAALRGNS